MSSQEDLEFHIGEHWLADFTATELGEPIDISGSTITFRLATLAGTTVMTITTSTGISITSGADGEFSLTVTPTQQTTAGVDPATRYQYEIKVETAAGIESVQVRGHLNVVPSLIT